jgi:hypothetical protein
MNYLVVGDMSVKVPKLNSLQNKIHDFIITIKELVCNVRFHGKISRKKKSNVWYCINVL